MSPGLTRPGVAPRKDTMCCALDICTHSSFNSCKAIPKAFFADHTHLSCLHFVSSLSSMGSPSPSSLLPLTSTSIPLLASDQPTGWGTDPSVEP